MTIQAQIAIIPHMLTEDAISQNYELAFHINPDLEEAKIQEIARSIGQTVTSSGGVIAFAKMPERARLSYPIKNRRNSYFGYLQFSNSSSEILKPMQDQLKLNNDIMRFLLLKTESDAQKKTQMAQRAKFQEKRARASQMAEQKKTTAKEKPTVKADEKQLEKQLEDIIEKL